MKSAFIKSSALLAAMLLLPALSVAQGVPLNGRIMEGDTRRPVQFAHVQNVSSRLSVFSDTAGFFHIPVRTGDTLVFSAIGFYYSKVVVSDSLLSNAFFNRFSLTPRFYEIEEARIHAFGTYEQFKHRFITLDLSKNQTEMLRRSLQHEALNEAIEADRIAKEKRMLQNGVTLAAVPILTPREKQMLKLKEVMAGENRKNLVYAKYNPGLVKKATGLDKDDEIIAFMAFCNFSDEFILEVSEYDLVVLIVRKYEEFRRLKGMKKPDSKSQMPFNDCLQTLNEYC